VPTNHIPYRLSRDNVVTVGFGSTPKPKVLLCQPIVYSILFVTCQRGHGWFWWKGQATGTAVPANHIPYCLSGVNVFTVGFGGKAKPQVLLCQPIMVHVVCHVSTVVTVGFGGTAKPYCSATANHIPYCLHVTTWSRLGLVERPSRW
jgi:hypothetical protein